MDAGIIGAFKRHYRRYHLQNAMDRLDRGETDLYKVDQLTAMRWCHAAWSEITQLTIANCFWHTGLFQAEGSHNPGAAVQERLNTAEDEEEQAVNEDLRAALNQLPLRNPMPIDSLLNPIEEDQVAHIELEDDEIIAMVQEGEKDSEEEEGVEEEHFTKADKLRSLSIVLSLLDVSKECDRAIQKRLHVLQSTIRLESTHQTTLDSWLL